MPSPEQYVTLSKLAVANAKDLIRAGNLLRAEGLFPQAFVLLTYAFEELARGWQWRLCAVTPEDALTMDPDKEDRKKQHVLKLSIFLVQDSLLQLGSRLTSEYPELVDRFKSAVEAAVEPVFASLSGREVDEAALELEVAKVLVSVSKEVGPAFAEARGKQRWGFPNGDWFTKSAKALYRARLGCLYINPSETSPSECWNRLRSSKDLRLLVTAVENGSAFEVYGSWADRLNQWFEGSIEAQREIDRGLWEQVSRLGTRRQP